MHVEDDIITHFVQDSLTLVRNKIERQPTLPNYFRDQYWSVLNLFENTIENGENSSLLLTGQLNTGKTMVVNAALETLKEKHQGKFLTVELYGFQHAEDERFAVLDILAKLEMAVERNEEPAVKNFGEALRRMTTLLEQLKSQSTSVFFILNNFDLFATLPKKQNVLYSLLDSLSNKNIQMSVIGVTCRLECLDFLEKRVKSRFSHNSSHFYPMENANMMIEVIKYYLTLEQPQQGEQPANANSNLLAQWNENVEKLISSAAFRKIIEMNFNITKDISRFQQLVLLSISRIFRRLYNGGAAFPILQDFVWASDRLNGDDKTNLLTGLSVLELGLVVAMRNLGYHQKLPQYTFEQVYQLYKNFVSAHSPQHLVSRETCLKAFELLFDIGLVMSVTGANAIKHTTYSAQHSVIKEYKLVKLMLLSDQVVNAVQQYEDCPTALYKWATSWVE